MTQSIKNQVWYVIFIFLSSQNTRTMSPFITMTEAFKTHQRVFTDLSSWSSRIFIYTTRWREMHRYIFSSSDFIKNICYILYSLSIILKCFAYSQTSENRYWIRSHCVEQRVLFSHYYLTCLEGCHCLLLCSCMVYRISLLRISLANVLPVINTKKPLFIDLAKPFNLYLWPATYLKLVGLGTLWSALTNMLMLKSGNRISLLYYQHIRRCSSKSTEAH